MRRAIVILRAMPLAVLLVLVLFAGVMLWGDRDAAERPHKPDIILISIDSLRPDHLGCYGYGRPTSPTIDALAQEGVRCASAVSTTSWTLPAHAALFTGLYDSAHGAVDNGRKLVDSHVTLAEALQDAGYQTAGFYGGPYLHPTFGFAQGFETYQSCMSAIPGDGEVSTRHHDASHTDITGPRTLERLRAHLPALDERPLFLFLHLWDVHYDYVPPPQYVEMFDGDYQGRVTSQNFASNTAINANMDPRDLEHIIALYDGEIRFTDDTLAQLLESLDGAGRLENALIVLTADHGEEFFEHKGKGHNRTLFDEVIRIPLIFRWPGQLPEAATVEQQVRLIDVMPTILGLTGIPLPPQVQGEDVSRLLRGGKSAERSAFCELLLDNSSIRAVRTNQSKVVVDGDRHQGVYYDLVVDPGEQRPQPIRPVDQELTRIADIVEECHRIRDRIVQSRDPAVEMDPELMEKLRSLGYIGGEPAREDESDEDR